MFDDNQSCTIVIGARAISLQVTLPKPVCTSVLRTDRIARGAKQHRCDLVGQLP